MQNYKNNNLLNIKRRVSLCRALGDSQRWLIMHLLLQKNAPCAVGELTDKLKIAPATISHHLRHLEAAGLIVRRRQGRFIYCRPRINGLKDLAALFQQLSGQAVMDDNDAPLKWDDASFIWS